MSGHIIRRGKTSWRLKFDIGVDPLTGKRRTRFHTFRGSKRDAEIKLAVLIAENSRGDYVDTSKATVAEFIDRWKRDWAENNVSPKTFERYSELLEKHVAARIGDIRLQKLRPIHLNELYGDLLRGDDKRRKIATRTVGHVHRVLHRALGHAHRWGLVQQNVAALVSPPRVASSEIELLTPAQVQIVLQKLQQLPIYSTLVTALATGMRRGELLALRWSDVDLDGALLRVERSVEETKAGGLRFKSPKTRHGRRSISLPPSAVSVIREHWKAQQEQRLKLGMGKAPPSSLGVPDLRWQHAAAEFAHQGMGKGRRIPRSAARLLPLAASHPCVEPDRRRPRRAGDQPPARPRLADDHARRLRPLISQFRRPRGRHHRDDVHDQVEMGVA
jgi:integrase